MLYFDYVWDLSPNLMIPDQEINFDRLGWREDDIWKVVNRDGKVLLVKVDPLVAFIKEGADDERLKD